MSLIYRATLSPSKEELVSAWLPSRGWATGRTIVGKVGEYRFDDPAGEVGVETILFELDDGSLCQVPLTYRAAPLEGADRFLVGTTQHSVLGRRWVYDGCGDPVWADTVVTTVLTGGSQSQMYLEEDGERQLVPARIDVRGSGTATDSGSDAGSVGAVDEVTDEGSTTVVRAGGMKVVVLRVVDASQGTTAADHAEDAEETLTGSWGDRTAVLVRLRRA